MLGHLDYWQKATSGISTSEHLPYISLLEIKDKCFYKFTKWAFTLTLTFPVCHKTADNRDKLLKYRKAIRIQERMFMVNAKSLVPHI